MGKFPIYSNLWLDSCQRNYTIDFLLITDQTIQNCRKPPIKYPYKKESL